MGWLWFGVYECEWYQCRRLCACATVPVFSLMCSSPEEEISFFRSWREKERNVFLCLSPDLHVFVPIGNELKFFWIDVIVKHWIVVYFVCAMANALHNRARSNAFLFNHFSFASSFDSTNRFSSFLIQQIQDQVKCEGFLRE